MTGGYLCSEPKKMDIKGTWWGKGYDLKTAQLLKAKKQEITDKSAVMNRMKSCKPMQRRRMK